MKFLALALTLLLAVGSRAASVQSDGPSQMEHVRSAVMLYLTQVKDSASGLLDRLDNTAFAEYKVKMSESLDNLYNYAQVSSQTATDTLTPYAAQLLDATKDVREKVMADVEELRTELEPKRDELNAVLNKHVEEYRAKLEPIFQEYMSSSKDQVEGLKNKLQPVLDELRGKVEVNVDETKSKIEPIVELFRAKLTNRLNDVKTAAAPYAEEYKEQLTVALNKLSAEVAPHTKDVQSKLQPYYEDMKTRFMSLYETVAHALQA